MILGFHLFANIVVQIGGNPRIIQAVRPHFGTPVRTILGVLAASTVIHVVAISFRWMMVTASRYPSRSPTERRGGTAYA